MSPGTQALEAGKTHTSLITLLAALAAAGGFALAAYLARGGFDPAQFSAVRVFPEPREVTVELERGNGESFGVDALRDRWTLMFFGFTHCPDICPTTMLRLAEIYKEMSPEYPALQVVFVSVDPDRDRGEILDQYTSHFNADFIGVTGDEAQLQTITRQFGVAYFREEAEEPDGDYGVGHTAAIMLVDPDLFYHAVLPAPHDAALITTELSQLLAHWDGG
ncbi:MAG: SCO family protein [Gammaproteobacteria bacterium]|nr:MAG: SCO family protein [Gammaproteobacteria bacterium]